MPIHDWTRVEPGDFHDFHQVWTVAIRNALNRGLLPPGYFAMTDQITGRPIPDVVALETRKSKDSPGGVKIKDSPPTARHVSRIERVNYAKRANRVAIRHGRGKVVAIIEIVSPGNKDSRNAIRSFTEKAADILNQGIHLLVVDLFPPTARDPHGIHKAIWDEFVDEPFVPPSDKPLTVVSYEAGDIPTAYVESIGVGDVLPSAPIFLDNDDYVPAPLESTYMQSWQVYPAEIREIVQGQSTSS